MVTAYISLGSNMGDKEQALQHAVQLLQKNEYVNVTKVSSIYDTDPVGYEDQDVFLNIVIEVETTLSAQQLLVTCQEIEQQLKRVRIIRWGPRTIDLDILLYNHENIETETLIVPHPRMHERAFVLVPLMEIAKDAVLPTTERTVASYLEEVGHAGVRVFKEIDDVEGFIHS
ncbi:2-amino-4-hydroxy-6-hydroxymethyldihydropteridine diphosphokinase [Kurthia senegalensis]|uniref:2-amino-4-hydroxy-6- hydroxymethyldihydropteridine diphosphokinase n=1 Tax=Kurthia senegalensis TaxID=1033740 RepID=UPI000288FDB4|nr:2-amino-4-hydroxy-6-hydroxymethyldihydropteridine diphosphokinase [Kurthia senegalensis]